ncbi:MAG: hypothetical protein JWN18_241 [Parcubacteria group bacterium]|nr:hypothetical protein [Parcubacteria group bacterium]
MFSTKKYIPILAAFIIGVTGAVGYGVHAQSVSQAPNVQSDSAMADQVSDGDGETADDAKGATQLQTDVQDPKQLDGETEDDAGAITEAASGSQEVESGQDDTDSDSGEVDSGN